jgi:senataxin
MVEAEAAILLMRSIRGAAVPNQQRLVLVGDPQQLPATVISQRAAQQGYSRSLFERLQLRGSHQPLMLNTQYRCNPEISLWPRQQFYNGRLQDGGNVVAPDYSAEVAAVTNMPALQVFDVRGSFEETGKTNSIRNLMEADTVMWLLQQLQQRCAAQPGAAPLTVGIITPYARQREDILQQCKQLVDSSVANTSSGSCNSSSNSSSSSNSNSNSSSSVTIGRLQVDVRSIDGFQGQERDVHLLSSPLQQAARHGLC